MEATFKQAEITDLINWDSRKGLFLKVCGKRETLKNENSNTFFYIKQQKWEHTYRDNILISFLPKGIVITEIACFDSGDWQRFLGVLLSGTQFWWKYVLCWSLAISNFMEEITFKISIIGSEELDVEGMQYNWGLGAIIEPIDWTPLISKMRSDLLY